MFGSPAPRYAASRASSGFADSLATRTICAAIAIKGGPGQAAALRPKP